jgi:hypothetical protein
LTDPRILIIVIYIYILPLISFNKVIKNSAILKKQNYKNSI